MTGYGQFCPVAKASEIITTRWTPLVLREMILGSRYFNDIHRGVPLMSRSLLSTRLKELEETGIVQRSVTDERKTWAYSLTDMGHELKPVILALGIWGQKWVESAVDSADQDAGVLMWDIRRGIDVARLPASRTVLQFDFDDAPPEMRRWWIVVSEGEADLCQRDPGHEVNLYISSDVGTLSRVWIAQESLPRALETDAVCVVGDTVLRRNMASWFALAPVATVANMPNVA